jgi:hypothetical protein
MMDGVCVRPEEYGHCWVYIKMADGSDRKYCTICHTMLDDEDVPFSKLEEEQEKRIIGD